MIQNNIIVSPTACPKLRQTSPVFGPANGDTAARPALNRIRRNQCALSGIPGFPWLRSPRRVLCASRLNQLNRVNFIPLSRFSRRNPFISRVCTTVCAKRTSSYRYWLHVNQNIFQTPASAFPVFASHPSSWTHSGHIRTHNAINEISLNSSCQGTCIENPQKLKLKKDR